jgi:hypothetical protein
VLGRASLDRLPPCLVTIFPCADNADKRESDIALEIREHVTNLTTDYIVDVWCICQIGSSLFEHFKQSHIRLEHVSEYRRCLAIIKAHTTCPFYVRFISYFANHLESQIVDSTRKSLMNKTNCRLTDVTDQHLCDGS